MNPSWYYSDSGKTLGPVMEDQLLALLASGTLTPQTLLWTEGMKTWQPAKECFHSAGRPDLTHPTDKHQPRAQESSTESVQSPLHQQAQILRCSFCDAPLPADNPDSLKLTVVEVCPHKNQQQLQSGRFILKAWKLDRVREISISICKTCRQPDKLDRMIDNTHPRKTDPDPDGPGVGGGLGCFFLAGLLSFAAFTYRHYQNDPVENTLMQIFGWFLALSSISYLIWAISIFRAGVPRSWVTSIDQKLKIVHINAIKKCLGVAFESKLVLFQKSIDVKALLNLIEYTDDFCYLAVSGTIPIDNEFKQKYGYNWVTFSTSDSETLGQPDWNHHKGADAAIRALSFCQCGTIDACLKVNSRYDSRYGYIRDGLGYDGSDKNVSLYEDSH